MSSQFGSALSDPVFHSGQLSGQLSLDAHISVRPLRARCLCLDRGRRQLDLGRSPSPLRLLGTVSRLIFVIPGSLSGLSGVDSKRFCSIPLVIYLLSCPFDSYFCILIVCELLAAFVTIFKKPNLIIIIIIIYWGFDTYKNALINNLVILFGFLSCVWANRLFLNR